MIRPIALFLLLFGTACVRSSASTVTQPATILRVENRAFLDMNIYVIRGAESLRLGTASGNSTTRLPLPARLIFGPTPLRFQADPIGNSRQPVTEEIMVTPGDEVEMVIPPQ